MNEDDLKILYGTEKHASKLISKKLASFTSDDTLPLAVGRIAAFLGERFNAKELEKRYDTQESYQNLMNELSLKESDRKWFYHSWNQGGSHSELKVCSCWILRLSSFSQHDHPSF